MIKLFLLALVVTSPLFAQVTDTPAIVSEETTEKAPFNPHKGHGLFTLNFEGMKYDVPFEFAGVKKNFSPNSQELYGGRLGYGFEMYLGKGFTAATKGETYFMGTLFTQVLNGGAQDKDVKFAYTKRRGQILGAEISQSIGYMFEMKTKNPFMEEWSYLYVEPFIEAGIGMARAYNRLSYSYVLAGTNEAYKLAVSDSLTNVRLGAGVNFTSNQGYFFFMKATYNNFNLTDRNNKGYQRLAGVESDPSPSEKGVKIDPTMVYALGGGYKF